MPRSTQVAWDSATSLSDRDEENGQEPDSSRSGQPVLCYEEAVGCKDSQAKDQWAGIEAPKRTRIVRRNLPLLRFFLSHLFNQPSTAEYIPTLCTHA